MFGLIKIFLKMIVLRPGVASGAVLMTILLGLFTQSSYQQFSYLQAQNIDVLSVFNEMIIPLAGLTLICQLSMSILAVVHLRPAFAAAGQSSLLSQASIKHSRLLAAMFISVLIVSGWPLIVSGLISTQIAHLSDLDSGRLGALWIGTLLFSFCSSLIIFGLCSRQKRPVTALLFAVLLVSILVAVEVSLRASPISRYWQGLFLPFFNFREGLLKYADIVVYFGWSLFAGGFAYANFIRSGWRVGTIFNPVVFSGLILIFCASLMPGEYDLSSSKRNTIASDIDLLLSNNEGVLEVVGVVNDTTSREEVSRGFQVIQQALPNSVLRFSARQSLAPEFQHTGEYVQFSLGKLHQAVAYPFEQEVKQVFENALRQLLNRKQQWITFVEGHGEASPLGSKASDLKTLYQALTQNGWPVAMQNLANIPVISENTAILVIASSKQDWLDAEVDVVIDYLAGGGNLWLLTDPESIVPTAIENYLGITRFPGTLVDWHGFQSGTPHPAVVIVNKMQDHPVVNQLNTLLAFPWSSGLKQITVQPSTNYLVKSIIKTEAGIWNELDINHEQLSFNAEKGEIQGQFDIALSLENPTTKQRVVVIGDSHFASETAINNYANKQFSLNILSWLTQQKIDWSQKLAAADNNIRPSRIGYFILNWGFSLVLPIFLLMLLIILYWQRNRNVQ